MRAERTQDENTRVVERQADVVYRICAARLSCFGKADVEDACQEVFLKYLKSAPLFSDEGHERAWFIRASVSVCVDARRAAARRLSREDGGADAAENVPAYDISGLEEAESVSELLSALPENVRDVVYLYYVEEYSGAEIAAMLGISAPAVRMRLSRGRDILKKKLSSQSKRDTACCQ